MNPINPIEINHQPQPQDQDLFHASCKFIQDTMQHPDARARQAVAVTDGCIVGGLKAVPDRIINHPGETASQVMFGAGTGALFGMATKIKSPGVAGLLAVGGAAMTLGYAWDLGQRLGRDRDLQTSLDNIWRSGDSKTYASAMPTIEQSLGKESFNLAVSSLSAGAGARAATLAGDMIGPATMAGKPCFDGAPNAMAKDVLSSTEKPDSALAMMGRGDRLDYQWNRLDPQALERYIQATPLSKRLNTIESSIDQGKLTQAFDHADANTKWHNARSDSYGDEHDRLAEQFNKIAMSIRNSWEEPNKGWLDNARDEIKLTRQQFGNDVGWPLKVAPDNLRNSDRLYSTPLSQRVDEIQALADNNMFKDASGLALSNCVLHLNPTITDWTSDMLGQPNKLYNPDISDRFDTLFLHLTRMHDPSVTNLVPETSPAIINDQLAALKKMSG